MPKTALPRPRRYVVAGKPRKQPYSDTKNRTIPVAMKPATKALVEEVAGRVGMTRGYFAVWLIEFGLSKLTPTVENELAERVQAGHL